MLQELPILESVQWEHILLGIFFITNVILVKKYQRKLQVLQRVQEEGDKKILVLAGDVKALYESGATIGGKVKSLEFGSKMLREEQEKLSLKDPDQQMYRNAVQQIHNGESVNKISESSGLSRGEIELLKLFQKNDKEAKTAPLKSVS